MEPKLLALIGYLGLSEENNEDIEKLSDTMYDYCGDTYKILTDEELSDEIDDIVSNIERDVQYEINHINLSDNYNYGYYMDLSVNYDRIEEEVKHNFPDYIRTRTYEEFDEFYIFLM